jgi:hypothetical protein
MERSIEMPERLTFTRFTELTLARLYEAEERKGSNRPVNLRDLMSDLEGVVPSDWPWDAAKYLIDHGLGLDFLTSGGAFTALTPEGRVFVESEQGSGIIGEYRHSDQVVVVVGDANQVAVGHGQQVVQAARGDLSKEEATELLEEAKGRIAADEALDTERRADVIADLEAARMQVNKTHPNRQAVQALLAGLGGLASIADIVEKLRSAF